MDSDLMSNDEGTFVFMRIKLESARDIQGVFDQYTSGPDDFQFNKTVIPVKLAQKDKLPYQLISVLSHISMLGMR
jgi:hypothetical protein